MAVTTLNALAPSLPEADVRPVREETRLLPLGRLKTLHAEAEETARLANLLGRSVYVTMTLALGAVAAIVVADTGIAREIAWSGLVLLAAATMMRAYRHTIAAPFERAALRSFAQDLNAILLFAGFAWGAGAFLALSRDVPPAATILFSTGMCAALAVVLRRAEATLHFIGPAAALTCAAILLRHLPGDLLTAVDVLAACALVEGVVVLVEFRAERSRRLPEFAEPSVA